MKKLSKCFAVCLVVLICGLIPSSLLAQTDTILVRYGNNHANTMNVAINQRDTVGVFVWTNGQYVADANLVLGVADQYIDSLLSVSEGSILYPLSDWDIKEFTSPYGSPPNPVGWSSQALFGWARIAPDSEAPWLMTISVTRIANFVVKTANDSLNIGDDAIAIGPGLTPQQGPSNAGDTLGNAGFVVDEEFSPFHFTGGGYVEGHVTNVSSNPVEGVNVTVTQTGKETYTDSEGFYHIGHYPANNLTFTFTHPEYQSFSANANVVLNQTTTLNATLHRLGIISGTVIDHDGDPIAGVNVAAGQVSDVTDDSGIYRLAGLTAGNYNVSFTHADYVDTTVNGVVAQIDQITTLNITLHVLGGITGTVTDTTGAAIEGVLIEILTLGRQTNSNAQGRYTFNDVNPGTYSLKFTHPDYDSLIITGVQVAYDVMTTVNASLDRGTGIDDPFNGPLAYSLRQNYPNPFNAETAIEYSIPTDAHVTLEIYDLLGRRVAVLVNDSQSAGHHKAIWNAGPLTSGMYFYRIQAGDFADQKSMMLLK